MKRLTELNEKELTEIQGGGVSELSEALWNGVGYVARFWSASCRLAAKNGLLTDPQFHSK
jgi:bacteriocin-like protein